MYKLSRINIEHSKDLFHKIKVFADKLRKTFPVQEVYVYGSFARGEIHEGSDIDLLIIGNFKERFCDRIGKILEITDLPVEPLVYTPEEFKEMINSENPFITNIMKTAIKL